MSKTNFENLEVYQLSEKLADAIWDVVAEWDFFARDTVAKQLVRAADSVGANLARARDAQTIGTTCGLSVTREDLSTKSSTSSEERRNATF